MSIAYNNHCLYPKSIYVRNFTGRVDVTEIIQSWEFLLNNNLLDSNIKGIINNLTDCQLDMNMNSFYALIGFLKAHHQFRKIKLAVICVDPRMIVFPTMGEVKEKSLRIKSFTLEESAADWIMYEV